MKRPLASGLELQRVRILTHACCPQTVPLGNKVDLCPKLRVIDVSATIAEVSKNMAGCVIRFNAFNSNQIE